MERREGVVLKGIDEPVDASWWSPSGRTGSSSTGPAGSRASRPTTVGREIELRFLQERMWDVVEEGRWRVVTVVGDAGVGKSRLLLDFDSWLAESPQPVYWFRGRASHTDAEPRPTRCCATWWPAASASPRATPADVVRGKLEEGFARPGRTTTPTTPAPPHLVGAWLGPRPRRRPSGSLPVGPAVACATRATEALAGYFARLSAPQPGGGAAGGPALGRRRLAALARRRRRPC